MKPSIGKELFARKDIVEATGGEFKSVFVTERFIHNDVRKYLLRSSTHWSSVQNELSNLNSASCGHIRDEGSIYSPLPESVSYRVLAEKVSNDLPIDFGLHLPAGIRENVVAKLLHDAGVQVSVDYSSVRSGHSTAVQSATGDETRTSAEGSQSGMKVDRIGSWSLNTDNFSNSLRDIWNSGHANSNAGHASASSFATAIDLSNAFSPVIHEKSSSSYIRKPGTEVAKMVLAHSSKASLYSSAERVYLCTEDGFGTSPIWYQQSMATGPPQESILAELIAV